MMSYLVKKMLNKNKLAVKYFNVAKRKYFKTSNSKFITTNFDKSN